MVILHYILNGNFYVVSARASRSNVNYLQLMLAPMMFITSQNGSLGTDLHDMVEDDAYHLVLGCMVSTVTWRSTLCVLRQITTHLF